MDDRNIRCRSYVTRARTLNGAVKKEVGLKENSERRPFGLKQIYSSKNVVKNECKKSKVVDHVLQKLDKHQRKKISQFSSDNQVSSIVSSQETTDSSVVSSQDSVVSSDFDVDKKRPCLDGCHVTTESLGNVLCEEELEPTTDEDNGMLSVGKVERRKDRSLTLTPEKVSSPWSSPNAHRQSLSASKRHPSGGYLPSQCSCKLTLPEDHPAFGRTDYDVKPLEDSMDVDLQCLGETYNEPVFAPTIFLLDFMTQEHFKSVSWLPRHPELKVSYRAILVDWMVSIQLQLALNHEVLYTAVRLVDMYMSLVNHPIAKNKFQLVGVSAMWIASKGDERLPPLLSEMRTLCDNIYSEHDVLCAERDMFSTVGYNLFVRTSYSFLRRFASCAFVVRSVLFTARFLLELTLMEYELSTVKDSLLAVSCLCLARRYAGEKSWRWPYMEYYSFHKEAEIIPIAYRLNNMLRKRRHHFETRTVLEKYSHRDYLNVASKCEPLPNSEFCEVAE